MTSFSCFWYCIQWNNLALDMEFPATITKCSHSRRNGPPFLSAERFSGHDALVLHEGKSSFLSYRRQHRCCCIQTLEVQSWSSSSLEIVSVCWTCLPTPLACSRLKQLSIVEWRGLNWVSAASSDLGGLQPQSPRYNVITYTFFCGIVAVNPFEDIVMG